MRSSPAPGRATCVRKEEPSSRRTPRATRLQSCLRRMCKPRSAGPCPQSRARSQACSQPGHALSTSAHWRQGPEFRQPRTVTFNLCFLRCVLSPTAQPCPRLAVSFKEVNDLICHVKVLEPLSPLTLCRGCLERSQWAQTPTPGVLRRCSGEPSLALAWD